MPDRDLFITLGPEQEIVVATPGSPSEVTIEGLAGTSEVTVSIVDEGQAAFVLADPSEVDVKAITLEGPVGPVGPEGPQGLQGPKGTDGLFGEPDLPDLSLLFDNALV